MNIKLFIILGLQYNKLLVLVQNYFSATRWSAGIFPVFLLFSLSIGDLLQQNLTFIGNCMHHVDHFLAKHLLALDCGICF